VEQASLEDAFLKLTSRPSRDQSQEQEIR
jgi:hypothetical protein